MKTTFKYDHYYVYDELTNNCKFFANNYPKLVHLESICKSVENRDVWAMTITNKETGNSLSKPAFYIDGNHHAGEVTGSMAAMHTMDYLLSNYGVDEKVTKLIDTTTIYIIPRMSVDGAETYLTTPYSLRSVNRPYNLKDGGLTQEDMNNDGIIGMMRVKSPFGAWKKGKNHELVMQPRQPDDIEGEFYNIYTEGLIENFDGMNINIRKPLWGLDFNRNYPFGWFSEVRQGGAGKYPLSNPENKAIVDFVLEHPNIGAVLTHHTSGGVILYPPGTKPEKASSALDMKHYREIGKMATAEMGYATINIFDCFMEDQENYSSGAFDDWCYQTQGILAYTVELWDLQNRAGMPIDWMSRKSASTEEKLERQLAQMKWIEENCPDEIMSWEEVEHPQLKTVEVSKWNYKFTQQNCPNAFLLEEVEKTTKFSLRFANTLPHLIINQVEVTNISKNIYKVEAIISNNGYLPTNISEEAVDLEVSKPIKVSLEGEYKILQGEKIQEIDSLAGFGQINTFMDYYGGISTGNSKSISKKVTWMIEAEDKALLNVLTFHEKSGKDTKQIQL